MATKSSTLCVATRTPGACGGCRHANQGTADFAEGRVFCGYKKALVSAEQTCDAGLPLPRSASTPVAEFQRYFLFEPFDGHNGTYGVAEDLRILAEDADADLRAALQADRAVIPAG